MEAQGLGVKDEGITTVWLLSMIGNVHSIKDGRAKPKMDGLEKKSGAITKRDILRVCIPRTCKAIQTNDNGLSLRNVSSLLYGIALCYGKKTEYVLNDLTVLLTQLQRSKFAAAALPKIAIAKHSMQGKQNLEGQVINLNSKKIFLQDDPNFDVAFVNNFQENATTAGGDGTKGLSIRERDYMAEVTNTENTTRGFHQGFNLNRPHTLDDIPIDMDFNLDIGDVVSQHGTKIIATPESRNAGSDLLDLHYGSRRLSIDLANVDAEDRLNFSHERDHVLDFDLEAVDQDVDQEHEHNESQDQQQKANTEAGPRGSISRGNNNGSFPVIKVRNDDRISLSTETLRNNHENYLERMELRKRKSTGLTSEDRTWRKMLKLDNSHPLLHKCWNFIFSEQLYPFQQQYREGLSNSIEGGRRHVPSDSITTNSLRSWEQGRKLEKLNSRNDIFFGMDGTTHHSDSDGNQDDLLLNLEQIDEDLEVGVNHRPDEGSEGIEDLMALNLNLPPSSYGGHLTRNGTTSSNTSNDDTGTIDILNWTANGPKFGNTGTSQKDDGQRSSSKLDSSKSRPNTMNQATRRFYEYISEKAVDIDKDGTQPSTQFRKKLFFEDAIPKTVIDAEMAEPVAVSKRIAAAAFMSLLNLASNDFVELETVQTDLDVVQGSDLLIYM
ncbi:Rec8p KNAG_0D02350 [Huiozyma naganishii CBS 8797]|uniref:Rad21/Rec8-like protein N-terminal domain-containing protein n=1 Tax=Huiozyma naganishii (strain ATCC MYA-139 / BCRC 22969 / CBS 8797 / KCTC 17520 / NBRC 10181 / NCYC 3082 / Yp74L-3) TaxID=1071383 RepID=J7R584_HUIN7|nr:hypothetical protein KNAG_0D02350 [Kazachstania naganishii CBS 8797]CCK69985.1 hypothetical protein KNAG_0D02350 [Kazachstania naganishii CBS 8797]